MSHINSG